MATPDAKTNGKMKDNEKPPAIPSAPRIRQRKPNYAKLHSKPLPLTIHPLPAFLPHNPLSLFRVAFALIESLVSPPCSRSERPYIGIFSPETSSVHITDATHIRALWEYGFFGKGTLSRSEPSWMDREKVRVMAGPGLSSEDATNKRREERRLFKLERAKAEREQIERQLQQERGKSIRSRADSADPGESNLSHVFPWLAGEDDGIVRDVIAGLEPRGKMEDKTKDGSLPAGPDGQTHGHIDRSDDFSQPTAPLSESAQLETRPREPVIVDQEHLQLTPEEAFFLSWGLGVLAVHSPKSSLTPQSAPLSVLEQLHLWLSHATSPSRPQHHALKSDNRFLLNYAVYHHFRSLGWVVRPGSKFATDYLLYVRGPVFSHAEFAVMILPEYGQDDGRYEKRRDWWWLHCINRVQTQVRKSLVLVYVTVPTEEEVRTRIDRGDIRALFGLYSVREFVLKRWSANRSRD